MHETGPAKFNGERGRNEGGTGGRSEQGEIGNGDTAPGGLSFLSSSNSDNNVCAHSLMLFIADISMQKSSKKRGQHKMVSQSVIELFPLP